MKVCIDVQSTIAQRAGVGRYTRMLVENLARSRNSDELALFFFDFMRRGMPYDVDGAELRDIRWFPGRAAQLAWKKINWPPFDAFSGPSDVYHFPNFILPPLTQGKSVVTIHDMSYLRHPEFAEKKNLEYLTAKIRETTSRADAIITVSTFSAQEVMDTMQVPREKIYPIHLGIDESFRPPTDGAVAKMRSDLALDRPYLLTVGTLEPRKNIAFLVDVFERMEKFDGYLVIAGMKGWKYEPILKRIQSSPAAERIRYLEYVEDGALPALYAGAECFLITSHYEGFGFPPLEAMACGTPAVSSCGGSLKEVLGDAAVTIESFDAEQWATQVTTLLEDTDRREQLSAKGRAHAAGYTWAKTAQKTWDVYRSL
jgi:glycosyltransferase involved in cell wall biosynthesis